MRGRKPKPLSIHALSGNPSKLPVGTAELAAFGTPEMPADLTDPVAVAEWHAIVPQLIDLGIVGAVDARAIAMYCESVALYRGARKQIAEHGMFDAEGRQAPAVRVARSAAEAMKSWLTELGGSPSARARMRVPAARKAQAEQVV